MEHTPRAPHLRHGLVHGLIIIAQVFFLADQAAAAAAKASQGSRPTAGVPPVSDKVFMRQVMPEQAYRDRENLGPHINFKVTPNPGGDALAPLLVEAYNHSQTYINVIDFYLHLSNSVGDHVEVHVTCDDIKPRWSALRWVKVAGVKKLPRLDTATIQHLEAFNEKGQRVNLKYFIDLIQTSPAPKPEKRPGPR